jgi:hypothetical protein
MEEEFDDIHVEPLDDRASRAAAARRQREIHTWVDRQVQQAIARGDFDDLPGAGKPVEGLDGEHDPDWWLKKLVEREQLVVLPPSIQLRKDDAELDDLLDRQHTERDARQVIEEFNARVLQARYQIPTGPPLVTQPRDVEEAIEAWRERRTARTGSADATPRAQAEQRRRRWFRRG